ncbi:MAG: hypothetical protein QNJ47_14175 [Nostocaceae cyanobacterium]|nr:hypothetical protein [Nostocaceae cyanobacterium]
MAFIRRKGIVCRGTASAVELIQPKFFLRRALTASAVELVQPKFYLRHAQTLRDENIAFV